MPEQEPSPPPDTTPLEIAETRDPDQDRAELPVTESTVTNDAIEPTEEIATAVAAEHIEDIEEPPMLEVHAPHEPIHTWKDFAIHIAAIAVGLLLAVGLEQTVEHIRMRYELSDAREALKQERKSNVNDLATAAQNWRWEMVELQNNLLILRYVQQHPGAPQTSLPGDLRWDQTPVRFNHAAWDAEQQNGIVRLMSLQESNAYQQQYLFLQILTDQGLIEWNAFMDGMRFELVDPDPTHLSPQQLAEQIDLTTIALEKHLQVGYVIAFIGGNLPDLPTHLSFDQVDSYLARSSQIDSPAMAPIRQLTTDRLAAAGLSPTTLSTTTK